MRRAALLLLLVLPLSACAGSPSPVAAPQLAAATTSPEPGPAAAPATLDSPVPRGTVSREPGPFDDRFRLTGTRLAADGVHTRVDVTSDVSDVLALEVVAHFYDARGALLGSGRATHSDEEMVAHGGTPDEHVELLVPTTPAWASRVTSAVLSVPVLVNE
ncbi:MAG: hypothetical protein JWN17_1737 [Frankiales bacterium]|nr:hypothetical protein [Frankiales bacterium]